MQKEEIPYNSTSLFFFYETKYYKGTKKFFM